MVHNLADNNTGRLRSYRLNHAASDRYHGLQAKRVHNKNEGHFYCSVPTSDHCVSNLFVLSDVTSDTTDNEHIPPAKVYPNIIDLPKILIYR